MVASLLLTQTHVKWFLTNPRKTTHMPETRSQPTMLQHPLMQHPAQTVPVLPHTQQGYMPAHLLPVKMEKMEEWGMGSMNMGDNQGVSHAPTGIPFELLSSSLPQLEYLLFKSDDGYVDEVGYEQLAEAIC